MYFPTAFSTASAVLKDVPNLDLLLPTYTAPEMGPALIVSKIGLMTLTNLPYLEEKSPLYRQKWIKRSHRPFYHIPHLPTHTELELQGYCSCDQINN